jgi:hypothetical protein
MPDMKPGTPDGIRVRWEMVVKEQGGCTIDDPHKPVWWWVGVRARAWITITQSFTFSVESAGLWGVESDRPEYHLEVFEEEKEELKGYLEMLRTMPIEYVEV